jgi:drug/metabolite transporter (DMT)-like permease
MLVGCGASALGILCFTEAFLYMNPALAVLMQKLQPIITISLGAILLREKISRNFVAWSLLAIVSSYFVSFGFADPFSGEWQKIAIGSFFALLAAFFWGSGTIWGKMLLQKYSQLFVMANRFFFGAIFTLIICQLFGNGLQLDIIISETKPVFGGIVYMALISGFVATTFFYVGLKWVNATLASILELFFPVSSVLIMWLSFNRPLSPVQIIACLVMFYAVYRVNLARES